jgi:aerobic carbon-monoxide dehydrogenase medium subunit
MAAAAVWYDQDAQGRARDAHLGAIGVSDRPLRLAPVEAVLNGRVIDEAAIAEADAAAAAAVDPPEDIHASAAYRRALIGTMVERALRDAAQRSMQAG